jgi:hypothetical protein
MSSVKFEKETVTKSVEGLTGAAADAVGKGKDGLLKNVGEAITKGGGVNGYLAVSGA